MNNPWLEINLDDYENHMSLGSVFQLQTMNKIMKEQFYAHSVKTMMILGVAGGNGLEHVDKKIFDKVYGVDINEGYLSACVKRYPKLQEIFEPVCADLSYNITELPCADLLVANLLIEYIGYDCFKKVVKQVMPRYISCVIQINTDVSYVSDSPYIHVFDRLDEVHHQMQEKALDNAMSEVGYVKERQVIHELPNGKKLVRIDFTK